MEEALEHFVQGLPTILLFVVIGVSLLVLGKAADWLVDEAVLLSERSGIPKTIIGATIVSLGTTAPEAAVSVFAAIQGQPGLALGNAVGSIICDTGLILGVACLIAPLKLDRTIVNRQGWIQLGAAVAMVAFCFPWSSPGSAFTEGGNLAQWAGFVFLGALAVYIWQSIRWAGAGSDSLEDTVEEHASDDSTLVVVLKLIGAVALVVVSARVLIPAVNEVALRMSVPESIIAATLVAFGTSLPELVTAGDGGAQRSRRAGCRQYRRRRHPQCLLRRRRGGGRDANRTHRGRTFLPRSVPDHAVDPARFSSWDLPIGRLHETAVRLRAARCVRGLQHQSSAI